MKVQSIFPTSCYLSILVRCVSFKNRICISFLISLHLQSLPFAALYRCTLFHLMLSTIIHCVCVFLYTPFILIGYTCISEFFVPLKCSICFCFIACHNSLSYSSLCVPSSTFFSLCIWQPFIWSCIPTYDLWLVFPRVLFRFFSTIAWQKFSLPISPPFSSHWNFFRNIRRGTVNIMLKYD